MTTRRKLAAAAILAALSLSAPAAEPFRVEIVVPSTCRVDWSEFDTKTWVNDTGVTLQIAQIRWQIVGADTLIGEHAVWLRKLSMPDHAWIDSFGVEIYSPPSQPVMRVDDFPIAAERYTIAPGDGLLVEVNCGHLNGVNWRQFSFGAGVDVQLVEVQP